MSVKYGILTILSQSPKHRYDLKVTLENMMYKQRTLNPGQVYSTIDRLVRDKLVEEVSNAENDLKLYQITKNGREEVERWLQNPIEVLLLHDEFFFKILCAKRLNFDLLNKMIFQQKEAVIKKILQLHYLRKELENTAESEAMLYLIEGGLLHLEADLKWMDMISDLEGY